MLDKLRLPFFVFAVFLLVLCVLIELGSSLLEFGSKGSPPEGSPPGVGIAYLALVDGLVLFTVALIASPLIISHSLHGRIQGIVTFVFSLLMLLGSLFLAYAALMFLVLMVSLLLAVPFGTIAYMAAFTPFPATEAAALLSIVMSLKLGFAVLLVLAHQRFLDNKGLVILILMSLGLTVLLGFLHNFPPGVLVSITDDIAALITAIVAFIWSIFYLIGSIPAIIKALRIDRAMG